MYVCNRLVFMQRSYISYSLRLTHDSLAEEVVSVKTNTLIMRTCLLFGAPKQDRCGRVCVAVNRSYMLYCIVFAVFRSFSCFFLADNVLMVGRRPSPIVPFMNSDEKSHAVFEEHFKDLWLSNVGINSQIRGNDNYTMLFLKFQTCWSRRKSADR